MHQVKMIITDLDMTVLHSDKSISAYTKGVFLKCAEKGIYTAIATARYYIGAEKYINILCPQYEITTDGTMTYHQGDFLFGTGFDIDTANKILADVRNIGATLELTAATDRCVYWNSENISESPVLYKAVYNDFSSPISECAYKIVAELPDMHFADMIGKRYDCKVICYRGENRYGFIHSKAGKMQSIYQLSKILNIALAEIAAFGDDLNDIEMLTECGCGVAVENALPEVKNAADCICDANDHDGVAKFIERNILSV